MLYPTTNTTPDPAEVAVLALQRQPSAEQSEKGGEDVEERDGLNGVDGRRVDKPRESPARRAPSSRPPQAQPPQPPQEPRFVLIGDPTPIKPRAAMEEDPTRIHPGAALEGQTRIQPGASQLGAPVAT